jgi:hypothetical protein
MEPRVSLYSSQEPARPPLHFILNHASQANIPTSYVFGSVLSSHLCSDLPRNSFPSKFPDQNSPRTSYLSHQCYTPRPCDPPEFDHPVRNRVQAQMLRGNKFQLPNLVTSYKNCTEPSTTSKICYLWVLQTAQMSPPKDTLRAQTAVINDYVACTFVPFVSE